MAGEANVGTTTYETTGVSISPTDKIWIGTLPKGCKKVYVQWMDDKGQWKGTAAGHARDAKEAMEAVEAAVRRGPCLSRLYRLVPVANSNLKETDDMAAKKATKKTATKKTAAAPKANGKAATEDLVGGLFRAGSYKAQIYELLSDGEPHTKEELTKAAKGCSNISGRIEKMRKNQNLNIEKTAEGYVLKGGTGGGSASGGGRKKAAKKTRTAAAQTPANDELSIDG